VGISNLEKTLVVAVLRFCFKISSSQCCCLCLFFST